MANDMVPITNPSDQMARVIEQYVLDPNFDAERFEKMVRLHMEVSANQAQREYFAGMAAVQSELAPVLRSAENKHLGNKYAPLAEIIATLQPVYSKHGFSVSFGSEVGAPEGYTRKSITVAHAGGHSVTKMMDISSTVRGARGGTTQMTDQQAIGSVSTYARRYLLTEIFNVSFVDEDDDGEGTRQTAQTGPRQPQGNGTGAPRGWNGYDTSKWAETLCGRLGSVQSIDGLNATMSAKTIVDWLADPNGATADDRARIDAAKQAAINRLTPKQDAKPTTPDVSPEAAALLAEIEVMTLTMIDALPTDPAFNQRLIRLPEAEQELVDAAIKAHARRLANGTAEHPDA